MQKIFNESSLTPVHFKLNFLQSCFNKGIEQDKLSFYKSRDF